MTREEYLELLLNSGVARGNKTKKKQLYSLGLKNISKLDSESIALIRRDFEKLILVFTQLKQFKLIDEVELQKEGLERK